MHLHVVGFLQGLFVRPPVLCVCVSPLVGYPHLFVSLPVCVSPGAALCETAWVSLCCSKECTSPYVGAGPRGGHQTDSSAPWFLSSPEPLLLHLALELARSLRPLPPSVASGGQDYFTPC